MPLSPCHRWTQRCIDWVVTSWARRSRAPEVPCDAGQCWALQGLLGAWQFQAEGGGAGGRGRGDLREVWHMEKGTMLRSRECAGKSRRTEAGVTDIVQKPRAGLGSSPGVGLGSALMPRGVLGGRWSLWAESWRMGFLALACPGTAWWTPPPPQLLS